MKLTKACLSDTAAWAGQLCKPTCRPTCLWMGIQAHEAHDYMACMSVHVELTLPPMHPHNQQLPQSLSKLTHKSDPHTAHPQGLISQPLEPNMADSCRLVQITFNGTD